MPKPTKTPAQVRAEFREAGISVAEWARVHKFSRQAVFDALRGKSSGVRGESHRVAVALGLKVGVLIPVAQFKPPPAPQRPATRRPLKAA